MLGSAGCLAARKWKARLVIPRDIRTDMPSKFLVTTGSSSTSGQQLPVVVKVRFQNGIVMIEWGGTPPSTTRTSASEPHDPRHQEKNMSTQIRVLKTDDHAVAVARLSELMDADPEVGSVELSWSCWPCSSSRMSRPKFPPTPPDPIEAIPVSEWIAGSWHRKDLAPYIGSMSKVSRCSAVNAC